ncbi:hypothetical protein K488DRAFT_79485 [Vararia minispora EC-137]|uniref:Uncharacterized protein n=1 Tax=Vararia minispora EC-137 TaxID=1314806 RepID=A0ACB8QGE6_9AGAM|nr:hypothetical protein K488DRAFT_79485 [Vararia minispora EC-137]
MSDSFANLWNSSAPTKPAAPQRTLGGAPTSHSTGSVAGAGARRPQYDAFSILAAARPVGSSTPSTRSQTPSTLSSSTSVATSKPASNGGDAFSGLISGSFGPGANNAGLSMAARTAKAEAEKRAALAQQQEVSKQQNAAWTGLDALGSVRPITPQTSQRAPSPPPDDEWLFGAIAPKQSVHPPAKPAAPASTPSAKQDDDWDLDDLISRPASSKPPPHATSAKPKTVWDLDNFESTPSTSLSRDTPVRSGTPGDFDFGDREDGVPGIDSDNEDDILGALGKPVGVTSQRSPPGTSRPASGLRKLGTSSPPPHLVGQLVEMGYSIEQARVALAATDNGEDLQAAVEILISGETDSGDAPAPRSQRPQQDDDDGWGESAPRQRFNYDDDDDDDDDDGGHQRRRPDAAPAPRRPPALRTSSSQREHSGAESYQQQADKLMAQASEIGLNVFNRANALWKQGKEQAKKMYEEQVTAAASRSSSSATRGNGQPRWMQNALAKDEERDVQQLADDDRPARPAPKKPAPRPRPEAESPPQPAAPPTGDLFGDEPLKTYRYRRPDRERPASAAPTAPAPKAPSPVALTQRQTISASTSAIASSNAHKATGTEMFKLGRYADAETAYSTALSQLPDGHLLLVPLLNNRAISRLKTGDTTGAVGDCTTVISLIGASYHPSKEARVSQADHGADVNLADALIKAWRRRAEAYEAKEKWDLARQDWESITGVDFAGAVRKDALAGAARCRQAVSAARQAEAPKPKPKPKSAPTRPPLRRGPTPPSEALNRLKQANAEADAEDQAKFELKDGVDARLTAWKAGKETNIRALISSLDSVLWPELGWQKVSMAELLSPNQVKIRYTKAIAKLHPDKLNARNTTVEQRMIANGVFGSLNDAWNAFQSSG